MTRSVDAARRLTYTGPALMDGEEEALPARFSIRRRLGEGGTGEVYEAWDDHRESTVALKVLSRVTPGSIYRFKNEFRALSGVSHPNLVTLHELLWNDDRWFLTMDLVEGSDFLGWVREGTDPRVASTVPSPDSGEGWQDDGLPTERRYAIRAAVNEGRLRDALAQLVDAIDALHEAGFLHRDIKPSNVLVSPEGKVMVLDFGLVRETEELHETLEERVVGTPAYMSPEQARGAGTTAASDWYGVGIMLYEALTGFLPFEGTMLQVLSAKQLRDPPDPRAVWPQAPPDLADLSLELLQRKPEDRPSGREIRRWLQGKRTGRPTPLPPGSSRDERPPFVGRKQSLALLKSAYEESRAGTPVAVEIRGPSGVGKTALVRYFIDDIVRHGEAVVLAGRCYERESVPYKAFDSLVDSMSRFLKRLKADDVESLLPFNLGALVRVFPVLRRVDAIRSALPQRDPSIPDPHELRRHAFSALRELLWRMGRRYRLVIFIDDLQWGDMDSADLLTEVLRAPNPPALLLLATYRTEEREESPILRRLRERRELLQELIRVRRLDLSRLDDAEALGLARALLGRAPSVPAGQRDALVRALVREAEGSPLFLGELARYARERGPAPSTGDVRFGSVLAQRVATLSPAARALLEAICVAGHPIAPRIVSRAAAVGKEAPSAFIELTAGHFVRSGWSRGSEAVEAFHDRIRENVSNILAPAERAEWHRRLAEAMEHSSQPDPEHLAVHLEAAGESDRALAFVLEAADYAAEMLAFDRAAELAARGLALMAEDAPDRSEVEERLGTALAHGGRSAEAADAFLRAADLEAGPDRVLDLKRRGAEHLLRSGHVDRGVDVIREVLGSVGLSLGRSRPRVLRSLLWHRLRLRMRGLDFEERDAADVDRALLRRIDTAWSVSTGLALIDVAQGARFQARHLLLALQAGEPYRAGRGLALEAGQLVARGIKEEQRAKQLLDRAEAIAQRLDHAHLLALTTAVRGVTSVFLSRWRESLNRMTLAEQLLRERCTNVAWELATVMRFQLLGLFYLGDLEELAKRAPRMIADGESRGDLYAVECGRTGVAAIAWLVRDETEEAVRQLDDAAARWTDRTYHLQHFLTLQGQVLVDFYEGRPERSIERFDSQWADLTASHLLRVQYIRVQTYFHRGSAALAALPRDDARAAEERVAERMAAKLDAENAAFATAFAESLHAGLARRRGDDHGFRRYLIASERRFEELEMEVFRRATQLARARFVGGQEGQKLEAEVREALLDIGAKRPEAVCRAVLPGLVDGRC